MTVAPCGATVITWLLFTTLSTIPALRNAVTTSADSLWRLFCFAMNHEWNFSHILCFLGGERHRMDQQQRCDASLRAHHRSSTCTDSSPTDLSWKRKHTPKNVKYLQRIKAKQCVGERGWYSKHAVNLVIIEDDGGERVSCCHQLNGWTRN